jgi:type I restriction enzyme, S subunit
MELKAGYKQTDAGVIPFDWDLVSLGDKSSKVGSGITPTGGERVYKAEGRPFLRSQNIGWGCLLMDDIAFIDNETHESFNSTEIEQGDVFLNITGASIGRSAVADERVVGGNVNQHVCIIRPNHEKLNYRFLNYFLLSRNGQRQIDSFQAGGNRQGLNFGQIRSFLFPLPPVPEQRAITTALNDVDTLIAALDRLIAKKRGIKQAAMQELLTGKRRLQGFHGKWHEKQIGDFTSCTAGGTPSTLIDSYWGGEIRWMNSGELHKKFVTDVEGRITKEGLENSSTKMIPLDCVLVGLAGQGKTRGTVAMNLVELCINQSIAAIYPSPGHVSEYLYYNLESRYEELRSLSSGEGGRGGLNLTIINSIRVPMPEYSEQEAIVTVLRDMDGEIETLDVRRDKVKQLKQGMMQELLTGRIRLVQGAEA